MNKIKILHIAEAAGGVDQYLKMLLKYLDKTKFENILVCSKDYIKEEYTGLADVFINIDMQHEISASDDMKSVREIRRLIKKYSPDVVYSHSTKAGALARLANIGIKNHSVYNPHGWAFNMNCGKKKRVLYIFIEKFLSHFCDKIVCISDAEKKSGIDKKICHENKLQVIFNGVDVPKISEHTTDKECYFEKLGIPDNAFVVGVVGRLSEQKAPDVFIEAASMIKKQIPEAFFIMVGDGEYREQIEKYANENGLGDSLAITGWVKNPLDYASLFDVAVLPSRWEGFGLVLAEYMVLEKPIIASGIDAIPDIVTDYHNGLLIAADSSEQLYQKVMELYNDKSLCMRLIKNGAEVVRTRFDVRRVAAQHEELIKLLCGDKNENR